MSRVGVSPWARPLAAGTGTAYYVQMTAQSATFTPGSGQVVTVYDDAGDPPPYYGLPIQRDPYSMRSAVTHDGFGTDDIPAGSAVDFDASTAGVYVCTSTFQIHIDSDWQEDDWVSAFGYHHRNVDGTEEAFAHTVLYDHGRLESDTSSFVEDKLDFYVTLTVSHIFAFEDGDYFWTSASADSGVHNLDASREVVTSLHRLAT